ncbi:MAG: DUF3034 family protein [Erythrobacter sp.]
MRNAVKIAVIGLLVTPFHGVSAGEAGAQGHVAIGYDAVLEIPQETGPAPIPTTAVSPAIVYSDTLAAPLDPAGPAAVVAERAIEPAGSTASAASKFGGRVFGGGKLLLTNGVASLEGTSGGGIATWAMIAGNGMEGGLGVSGHLTAIELPDFGWRSYGVAAGIGDRIELSYARQNFDTRSAGALLGLGQGYTFNQDVYAAKLRLAGDVVYGAPLLPQLAVGVEYKRSLDAPTVALLGASERDGVDYTLSATKLVLEHSVLVNATARLTKANQLGLLGFGGPDHGYKLQFEGSLAYMLSRRAVVGAEYRSKPDNLELGEDNWLDIFAAYALTDNITLTAAYVDLGSIATFEDQRGGLVQAQIAF